MGTIQDPLTGNAARVNEKFELIVRAIIEAELEHSSDDGLAYSWDSTERDIDAGDTMLFIKNTGAEPLHLNTAIINGSNVICFWEILTGQATTTPAGGTVITPVNMNRSFSSKAADAEARSDETAVADGDLLFRVKTPIDNTLPVDLTGIILGRNHYVQINQVTESDSGSVIIIGHFED